MSQKAIYYHAGCPVCVDAEQLVASVIDKNSYEVEIVHLGENRSRIAEAEAAGVISVPALVIGDRPFHINFGATLDDVKGVAK